MKNYLKIIHVLCFLLVLIACSHENTNTNEIQQKDIEHILSDMKKEGDAKGKIVIFSFKDFKNGNHLESFDYIENSKKVLSFTNGTNDLSKFSMDTFTVSFVSKHGNSTAIDLGKDIKLISENFPKLDDENFKSTTVTYTPSLF